METVTFNDFPKERSGEIVSSCDVMMREEPSNWKVATETNDCATVDRRRCRLGNWQDKQSLKVIH